MLKIDSIDVSKCVINLSFVKIVQYVCHNPVPVLSLSKLTEAHYCDVNIS